VPASILHGADKRLLYWYHLTGYLIRAAKYFYTITLQISKHNIRNWSRTEWWKHTRRKRRGGGPTSGIGPFCANQQSGHLVDDIVVQKCQNNIGKLWTEQGSEKFEILWLNSLKVALALKETVRRDLSGGGLKGTSRHFSFRFQRFALYGRHVEIYL
jgi:hypothetical protein